MKTYDTGLLADGGGGDVQWWQDYLRAELERAHEFYCEQWRHNTQLTPPPPADERVAEMVEAAYEEGHTDRSAYKARLSPLSHDWEHSNAKAALAAEKGSGT